MFIFIYLSVCFLIYYNQEIFLFHSNGSKVDNNWKPNIAYKFQEFFLGVNENKLYAIKFLSPKNLGTIIYFHGNMYSIDVWQKMAIPYLEQGFNVVIPTYRGFSKSNGEYRNESELLSDGLLWYDKVAEVDKNIVLVGRSLGTGVATYIASKRPALKLLLETPYDSITNVAKEREIFKYFPIDYLLRYPLNTGQWIGSVNVPIYIIHGTLDGTIPPIRAISLARVFFYNKQRNNNLERGRDEQTFLNKNSTVNKANNVNAKNNELNIINDIANSNILENINEIKSNARPEKNINSPFLNLKWVPNTNHTDFTDDKIYKEWINNALGDLTLPVTKINKYIQKNKTSKKQ